MTHARPHRATLAPWLLVAAAWVSGCATRPPANEDMPWTSGRLSVRVDANAALAARSFSASFDLRGSGEHGELRLTSPLGVRVATAIWAPGIARLTTHDGETVFNDLDALAQSALGEPLPLAALPDWLAGRPWPKATSQTTDAGFDQLGWRLNLSRLADGFVDAVRTALPTVTLRARIER